MIDNPILIFLIFFTASAILYAAGSLIAVYRDVQQLRRMQDVEQMWKWYNDTRRVKRSMSQSQMHREGCPEPRRGEK